jgi:IclR family mhp operon transcriptional activator
MKSLEKSFDILEIMNRHALATLADLHAETGLPKPTVARILKVLAARGYVEQVAPRGGWRLAGKVTSLSAGFHGGPAIVAVGRAHADRLTARRLWPVSIATLDMDAMTVRYSTIPQSPLAHVASTLNKRLSLTARAHGRAYLAFCRPAERAALMALVAKSRDREDRLTRVPALLEPALKAARRCGYATRHAKLAGDTETVAAPIRVGDRVLATFGMTFFRRAVTAEMQAALARDVIAAADAVARDFATGSPGSAPASPGRP